MKPILFYENGSIYVRPWLRISDEPNSDLNFNVFELFLVCKLAKWENNYHYPNPQYPNESMDEYIYATTPPNKIGLYLTQRLGEYNDIFFSNKESELINNHRFQCLEIFLCPLVVKDAKKQTFQEFYWLWSLKIIKKAKYSDG